MNVSEECVAYSKFRTFRCCQCQYSQGRIAQVSESPGAGLLPEPPATHTRTAHTARFRKPCTWQTISPKLFKCCPVLHLRCVFPSCIRPRNLSRDAGANFRRVLSMCCLESLLLSLQHKLLRTCSPRSAPGGNRPDHRAFSGHTAPNTRTRRKNGGSLHRTRLEQPRAPPSAPHWTQRCVAYLVMLTL